MPVPAEPNSAVWSAMGWDGKNSLVSADLHFARIRRHAEILGIDVPEGLSDIVLAGLGGLKQQEGQNIAPKKTS